ncbi:MAG: radical SAM protein [Ruminococcus sp.]|nr:radical SAM protein [Ruminococcus sp.]
MNLTLHLTDGCNMDCTYCTQDKRAETMTPEVLHAACRLAFSEGAHSGLCFFGGEPLLCEDLIFDAMDTCAALSAETGKPVYYRMTTNGTLLSERLLARAASVKMETGISFDGLMQDVCRKYRDGAGTLTDVEAAAKRLLAVMPGTTAMMTAAPQAVEKLAASVRYLYGLGFRNINAVPAYGNKVSWDEAAQEKLFAQLAEAAEFYAECLLSGEPFYFSPVESKIRGALEGRDINERCHLGFNQMPVAPDGNIYACNQFIGDEQYCVGNVFDGISRKKCAQLAIRYQPPAPCRECPLRKRCLHSCGCLNKLETGSEGEVSAFQCRYEKTLIHISDETAVKMRQAGKVRFERYFRCGGSAV